MKNLSFLFLSLAAALTLGCGAPAANTGNSNTTISGNANLNININSNAISTNANTNATGSSTGATIETTEPDVYTATVTLKLETMGDQKMSMPSIQANVARNGADRRMEFSLPNGEKLIYLDKGEKQFVISPNRKQYAELTKEALGFEVRRLLMPGEIVNQVKNIRGVERVGEEQLAGRTVVKYRYGATANTGTQAGQVNTESFVYVDKETSLPLRSETVSQSQGGNVQGVSGVRIGTEMSNITTTVDASLFAEPTDFKKVAPEEVRQQVNMVFSAAMAIAGQLMRSNASQQTPPANQAQSPSPAPTQ
ncbi:MAG TPA: hypothetical protein VK400_04805 [Pyrinomonadaceae bacterium]|nr:hypothetical protein [Pyrinomonadaceae bacterium]